jgi:hypothetical protein
MGWLVREIEKKRYPSGRSPAIASLLRLNCFAPVPAYLHLANPALFLQIPQKTMF